MAGEKVRGRFLGLGKWALTIDEDMLSPYVILVPPIVILSVSMLELRKRGQGRGRRGRQQLRRRRRRPQRLNGLVLILHGVDEAFGDALAQ